MWKGVPALLWALGRWPVVGLQVPEAPRLDQAARPFALELSAERAAAHPVLLVRETAADELMVTTVVHEHRDRLRSYQLVWDEAERLAGDARRS